MSLESKSLELKDVVATYNSDWFLGDLSSLIHAGRERANDQLGQLSSPMRQLYYLAGLNISSDPAKGVDVTYSREKWAIIVRLLNEIEQEYSNFFLPSKPEDVTEEWKRIRKVAMPSFLTYFNQGPLNYEEQVINWVRDLFTPFDNTIEKVVGVNTEDFIQFYLNLDQLHQRNFEAHGLKKELLRPNWDKYTKIKMGVADGAPDFIREQMEEMKHIHYMMADRGIIDRFYPTELVSKELSEEKVTAILNSLVVRRQETGYLYYTATKPGNPLYDKPILDIDNSMYQVFEVKQVIHAIQSLLEKICSTTKTDETKYVGKKGKVLEGKIVELFKLFFKTDFEVYTGYYVDGCEQDILFLWKKYAFIIEAKGYSLHEPFRNPEKAFERIKNDFKSCIGYGYTQTRRVEEKFIDRVPLKITDKNGNLIKEIDTEQYEQDFSIIVNLESFGQIQCDLSTFITLKNDDDVYPWAIRLDDLETFILTMIAKKSNLNSLLIFS